MKLKTKPTQTMNTSDAKIVDIVATSLETGSTIEEVDHKMTKSYIVMQKLVASLKDVKTDTEEAK